MPSQTIVDLPIETLLHVVRKLSPLDRFSLLLTCQQLRITLGCNRIVSSSKYLPEIRQAVSLTNLPVELLVQIFRLLGNRDRFSLRLSCKWMEEVVRTNLIGFLFTKQRIPHLLVLPIVARIKDDFALQKLLSRLFWTRYASHDSSCESARLILKDAKHFSFGSNRSTDFPRYAYLCSIGRTTFIRWVT